MTCVSVGGGFLAREMNWTLAAAAATVCRTVIPLVGCRSMWEEPTPRSLTLLTRQLYTKVGRRAQTMNRVSHILLTSIRGVSVSLFSVKTQQQQKK